MSTEVEQKELPSSNVQKIDNDVKSEGELEIDLLDDEHDSVKELRDEMAEKNKIHYPSPATNIRKRQIKKSLSSNTSRLHFLTESPSFEITPPSPSESNGLGHLVAPNGFEGLSQKNILRLQAYNNKLLLQEKSRSSLQNTTLTSTQRISNKIQNMDTTEIPGIELLQSSGNEIAQQKIKDMLTQFIQQVYIFKGKKDEELLNRLISDNGNSGGSNSSSPNSNGSGSGGSSHDRSNCVRLNGNADSYKWYWIIMDKSVLEGATGPKCKPDNHIITYNDRLNFKWVCHACRKRAKTLSDVVLHIALEHRTNEKIIIHDIDGNKLSDLIYSITDDYGRKIDKFKQANSSSNNASCPTNTAANIPLDKSTLPTLPNLATNVSLKHSSSSNSSSENLIPPVSRNVKAKLMQSKSFDVNDSKFNLLTRHTAMLPLLNSDNNLQEINTPSTNGMGTPVGGMSGTHARHDRSNSGPIRSHPPLLKTRSMSPYFVGSKNRKNLPFSKLTDNNNKNLGVDFDIKKEVKISNSSHVTRQGKSKYKAMTEYYQQKNDQDTANMASVLIGGNGATQKLHNNSIGHNNAAKVAQAAQVQAAQVQTNDTTTPVTAQTAQSALNAATAALANTLAQSSVPSQNSQKPQLITKDSGFSENNIDKSIKFNQGPGASANGELSVLQVLQRSQANQAANAALTVNTSQANLNASPNVGINFSNSSGLLSTNIGTIDSLITNNNNNLFINQALNTPSASTHNRLTNTSSHPPGALSSTLGNNNILPNTNLLNNTEFTKLRDQITRNLNFGHNALMGSGLNVLADPAVHNLEIMSPVTNTPDGIYYMKRTPKSKSTKSTDAQDLTFSQNFGCLYNQKIQFKFVQCEFECSICNYMSFDEQNMMEHIHSHTVKDVLAYKKSCSSSGTAGTIGGDMV